MTRNLEFKQSGHLNPALSEPATRSLSAEKLTGRWVNTNRETDGIAECTIEPDGNEFTIRALGVGVDRPIAWPMTTARPLANLEEEANQRAMALVAIFDFGFMRTEAYLRVNKGVLVIVVFNIFQDDSGRSHYVNREFFYRQD